VVKQTARAKNSVRAPLPGATQYGVHGENSIRHMYQGCGRTISTVIRRTRVTCPVDKQSAHNTGSKQQTVLAILCLSKI